MSIQSEITRISGNVADALDAIEEKGVTVPAGSNSDDLADLIGQITGGGSGGIVISDAADPAGGTVRTITAVEISGIKNITANGTGIDVTEYAAVNVAVPASTPELQTKTNISPTESSQTITADAGYDGLDSVQINAIPSQYIVPSGNKDITANGNNIDVAAYSTVSVNVASSGKAAQIASGLGRVNTTTYSAVSGQSITVGKTGTYDVYWVGYRSSTSGTSGSQLYVGDTAHSSGAQTTFNSTYTNWQIIHLTNVSLTKDQVITVRARARNTSYYMYVANLTIIEA